jgi:lysyl endopeptidase
MKKLLFVFFVILSFASISIAQLSQGGEPKSFSYERKLNLNPVIFEIMPFVDEDALRAEDEIVDKIGGIPWRFGENIEVDYSQDNSGAWDFLPGGDKIWRLGILSENAKSINLTFDRYYLPQGAELFIYNHDRTEIIGAFTHENNQEHGMFATTLVAGSAIIVEYYEPFKVEFTGELSISMVTHGYRGPKDYFKSLGDSGPCNVNVACPLAAGWEDQINSVAMMVSGGNGFCTGTMINNTANDGTPYFLTANHCYSDPSTWVFWFNWQSTTCSNPGSSPSYNSLTGATLRARNAASDFCLVELNNMPPESYGAYWAGWNRTTATSLSEDIIGIHHPSGDIKKFSISYGGVSASQYGGAAGSGTTHWRIVWSEGTTTEPGSSGSAIYDSNGRIIGQLHGGSAACGNTSPDYYGRLGVSWTGGGSNATRLSNWLDPSSTGETVIDGTDPYAASYTIDAEMASINVPVSAYTESQQITPQVTIKNNGTNNLTNASVSYTLNGGAPVSTAWSGNLSTGQTANVSFNPINIVEGNHVFVATVNVSGDEDVSNNSLTKNFSVVDCGGTLTIPYTENFNSADLPACWSLQNGHASNNWTSTTGYNIGGTTPVNPQSGSHFWYVQWIAQNQNELLITPEFDFSSINDPEIKFWFNGSYHWSVTNDNCDLDLLVRVNGGGWTSLWNETDNAEFSDETAYEWLETIVNLAAYQGQTNVQFAFRYTGNDGANFGVDNINISGTVSTVTANFTGNPLSVELGQNVVFTDASTGEVSSWSWNFGAGANPATANTEGPHNVVYNTEGYKTVSLTVNGSVTETKTNYIAVFEDVDPCDPINSFSWNENFNQAALPECWSLQNGHASNNWTSTTGYSIAGDTPINISPQSGSNFWYVQWIAQNQNELLITPEFDFSSLNDPEIKFWFNGSYHWSVTNDNCDLDLLVRVNGGGWTSLWNETDNAEFSDETVYEWIETTLDLSAYEGQSNVQFAFRYTGNDGANFGVDNITIQGVQTQQYALTVSTIGDGTVTVNGNPYTVPVTVNEGTILSLQANPSAGYDFNEWTGSITGTANPQNITMNSNKSVTAEFILSSVLITENANLNVSVYPNPAKDFVTVNAPERINKIVIHDVLGKTILTIDSNNQKQEINITSLEVGMYFITVYTENSNSIHKLQKGK